MQIEINHHSFLLLSQKAVYWINTSTLLIGDLHLGKVTHFRREGIALPTNAISNNFRRLNDLMNGNDVRRIIFLGDLFHNRYNKEWDEFASWRKNYTSVEIINVLGNHDIIPLRMYKDCNVLVEDYIQEGNFLFTHHPVNSSDENIFNFCGHIHPVFSLRALTGEQIRLTGFVLDYNQLILPSFGVFTGGFEIKKKTGRRIFVIAGNEVFKI